MLQFSSLTAKLELKGPVKVHTRMQIYTGYIQNIDKATSVIHMKCNRVQRYRAQRFEQSFRTHSGCAVHVQQNTLPVQQIQQIQCACSRYSACAAEHSDCAEETVPA